MALVRSGDPRARQVPGDGDLGADATIARWQIPSTGSRPYRLPLRAPTGGSTTLVVAGPGALALAGKVPALRLAVIPAPASATLAGAAPSLSARLIPGTAAAALSGLSPSLRATLALGSVDALALAGAAPSLSITTPGVVVTLAIGPPPSLSAVTGGTVALATAAAPTRRHLVPELANDRVAPAPDPELVPEADALFEAGERPTLIVLAELRQHVAPSTAQHLAPTATLAHVAASSAALLVPSVDARKAPTPDARVHFVPPPRAREFYAP